MHWRLISYSYVRFAGASGALAFDLVLERARDGVGRLDWAKARLLHYYGCYYSPQSTTVRPTMTSFFWRG